MKAKPSTEDLIHEEARRIAREKLEHELEIKNLPLPKDSALEIHLDQILKNSPEIWELAETRVTAKTDAYTESAKALGLSQNLNLDIQL